jgi:hypothetical protein
MFAHRRSFLLLLTIGVLVQTLSARAQDKPISTTVCEVTKYPAAFDNKIVHFRATYVGNFEISSIRDPERADCPHLSFTYPGGEHSLGVSLTLGPAQPRATAHLKQDEEFHRFGRLLDAHMYPRHQDMSCIDCSRYEVTAVMTGLIEFAGKGLGFGHMNMFSIQFVLQSIERTSVRDLAPKYKSSDFSTTPIRFPTGYVTGTLIGPDDQPIVRGELNIYPAIRADPSAKFERDSGSATTDEQGRFKFAVPPGRYIIGFNTFWVPSPVFPFLPTYYSSTQQRSEAKVVAVADRQQVGNLIFKLPKPLIARTISVKVLLPDGNPVENANVWLSQVSNPVQVVGISVSHTAANGSFDLIGLEGTDYILHADKYAGLARVSCARSVLIRKDKPILTPIQLSLSRTDFDICKNIDFEVPTDDASQP